MLLLLFPEHLVKTVDPELMESLETQD